MLVNQLVSFLTTWLGERFLGHVGRADPRTQFKPVLSPLGWRNAVGEPADGSGSPSKADIPWLGVMVSLR